MMSKSFPNINLVFRKEHPGFFSIERVFEILSSAAPHNEYHRRYLPFTSRGLFAVILNLIYLSRFRKGIFHVTGDIHYAVLVLPKDRTVLTIHDLIFLHTYRGLRRRILKYIFLDLPVKKAKWITTISEKSKKEIVEHTGCSPDKVMIIPNPVDPSIRYVRRDADPTRPVLLFMGTKENKNLEVAIASLFGIKLHLRIVGELTNDHIELLNKYSIDYSNVLDISNEDLVSEYVNADVLFFPSTYEGFGLPIIEGFQAGRPVITSNISPMNEIASGAALLVDPYSVSSIRNGVLSLINNKELREHLVISGFDVVKKYQPEAIIKQYEAIWTKINS